MTTPNDLPRFVPVTPSPREWRVGDVIECRGKQCYVIHRDNGGSFVVDLHGKTNVIYRPTGEEYYPNLGPHRIEPDGNGGLRFVKVEEEGWVRLEKVVDHCYVQMKHGGRRGWYGGHADSELGRWIDWDNNDGDWVNCEALVRVLGTLELPKQESK